MIKKTVVAVAVVALFGGCAGNKETAKVEHLPNPRIVARNLALSSTSVPATQNGGTEALRRDLEQARQDLARLRAELEADKRDRNPRAIGAIAAELGIVETKIAGIEAVIFRVPFKFDSATFELNEEAGNALVAAAKTAGRVRLKGRTDGVGALNSNLRIAMARANSAREFLVKHGVPAKNIQVSAQATGDYVAPNTTPEGRAKNRRVEVVVIGKTPGKKTT
jgi:flagellar motor protein MotB